MDNINLQTKKIFLYARKSTDEPERQVLSIEAQMFELREYAKKENLNIVREFVESKTAKEPGREIFNEMIASIEKNEVEGILAWHPLCQIMNLWITIYMFYCMAKKNFFVKDRLNFF